MRAAFRVFCALAFTAAWLPGQSTVGSIGGIVQDSSGGVMAGVKVTVTDEATNVNTAVVTNNQGNYVVPFLKPGTYRVTFEKQGFEKRSLTGIGLVLNQDVRLDAAMQPGSLAQTVSVEATGTQVNRVSSEISGEIGHEDLINLPESIGSHGASALGMVLVFPGISGSSPDYSNLNDNSFGGGRTDTVPIIIDGLPSNMGADNTYGFVPSPYSAEELQVLTVAFSAQYGQTGGGAILTSTKAGTNDPHGVLFETHNDQSLNALELFQRADHRAHQGDLQ